LNGATEQLFPLILATMGNFDLSDEGSRGPRAKRSSTGSTANHSSIVFASVESVDLSKPSTKGLG